MPLPLAVIAAKFALPFAAKAALKVWMVAQSSALFSFLAAHGLVISAGAQAYILAAAVAGKYSQMTGGDESDQMEAMTKAVGWHVGSEVKEKIIDFLNT